ncbi:MAG: tripartite tricarboxylate transporter TctB family protein [Pseudomonadota bacterium]
MRAPSSFSQQLTPRILAPVFTAALGVALFLLSLTQPAWLDDRIGPGLFARWLSAGVIALSTTWFAVALMRRDPADSDADPLPSRAEPRPSPRAGAGLLGGVAAFALTMPMLGLVAASALAALVASWGAGDRGLGALTLSGLAGGAAALAVGLSLLPPGARLWPPGL